MIKLILKKHKVTGNVFYEVTFIYIHLIYEHIALENAQHAH